nr:E3 ubiquitin-protein ligase MBR2-like [Ipomoea batatas]
MQRRRSILDSFPETIDLNQGSVHSNTSMDQSNPWDNYLLDPVEGRFSNSMVAVGSRNADCAPSFSGWDQGESSSTANSNDRVFGSDLNIGHGWSSSSSNYAVANESDPRLEERGFEPSNDFIHERGGSQYGGNHLIGRSSMPPFSSNHSPGNANMNGSYHYDDDHLATRRSLPPSLRKSGGSETELIPAFGVSSNNLGTSYHSDYFMGNNDASDSSLGMWGLSCKRKGLEGKPGQSCAGGSSSSNPRADDIVHHSVPAFYASSSSNLSSSSNGGILDQVNSRNGLGTRVEAVDMLPPLSVDIGVTDSSTRNFGIRDNIGNQQSVAFGLQPGGSSMGHSNVSSGHVPPRPFSISYRESRHHRSPPVDSSNPPNQSESTYAPRFSRDIHSDPWSGSQDAQGGSSSSPNMLCGERSFGLWGGESSFRRPLRNSGEHRIFYSATEARNLVQDGANWNLATSCPSQDIPSSSGACPGSSQQAYPTRRVVNQNPTIRSHQRLSESSPWALFTPSEYEQGSQRGHLSQLPSGTTSSEEPVMSSLSSSRSNRRPYLQSTVRAVEAPRDDHGSWRALAADIEGRHRMVSEIRQVLNAMQRVENLRAEDYAMFDPFINGVAELHDRHRDMRLDVDSMSYEELLALEERIGNVNTGLSEETILGSMKQHKYERLLGRGLPSNVEPCCICQEEYVAGENIGTLQCGHLFHTDCIKKWLTLKNLCPICKITALEI